MIDPATDRRSDAEEARGLATLFLRNRHLLWLSITVILVAGTFSAMNLPRLEDPRIVNRGLLVLTPFPGASSDRVESLVTEVLEDALDEIDAIKDVESTSRAGMSVISVELVDAVTAADNAAVFAEVRDRIGEAAPQLPADAGPPVVDDKREAIAFTLVLGVTWDRPEPPQLGLLDRLAEDLADRIQTLPGTELVRVYGEPAEEITVTVDADELAELGMHPGSVAERLAAADARRPAGVLRDGTSDLLVEVTGELDAVDRVAEVPLATSEGGSLLAVGDVAEVRRGWRTPDSEIALIDGRRSVLVAVRAASAQRIEDWAAAVDGVLADFTRDRAPGIRLDRVFEQEPYTSERLTVLSQNLLAGGGVILLAILVIMGLRSALVVATALPLVVCLVVAGWQFTGEAVHQISVFGLIIALGLLIDNAIVVTDEVGAHRAAGHAPAASVGRAVRHLALPLAASTLTTVLAFAPILLLPGSSGDFVGSIGGSVIMAVIASLFVALTIVAALAGLFVRPTPAGERRRWWRDGVAPAWLATGVRRGLHRLYAVPALAICLALIAPLAGFAVAPHLGNSFFPPTDRDMFEVRVKLPEDASIHATRAEVERIDATLRGLDGVETVDWMVGGSFPSVWYNLIMDQDGASSYAHGIVLTESPEATKQLLNSTQFALDEAHPAARILVRQFVQGPPVVADVEYRLFGPGIDTLQALGDEIRVRLQGHPDVVHTESTMPRGEPKLFFDIDESAARLAGLGLGEIAAQMEAASEGRVAGSVLEDLEQLPIRVRTEDARRRDLDALASTPLVRPGGDRWTTAATLGAPAIRPEVGGITRFNGERTNIIKAYVHNDALPLDVSDQVLAALESGDFQLPPGYRLMVGGASEQDSEATGGLAVHAPILATLMVATLVLAFRSVRLAMLLGVVALCSLGLALLSTWSIDFPISFNTMLGTLGLIGVALNDSIVVIASVRANPKAVAGDRAAMVDAVMGCMRHVVATTVTTIGGFLPLLLFVGGDFWPSVAIVLAGGIGGASLVALLLIPAAMLLMAPRRSTADGTTNAPVTTGTPTPALA